VSKKQKPKFEVRIEPDSRGTFWVVTCVGAAHIDRPFQNREQALHAALGAAEDFQMVAYRDALDTGKTVVFKIKQ
jgi:hypothetical protein